MRKIVNAGKLLLQKLLAPFSTSDKMNIYLTSSERARLEDYQEFWNFYNGYHWCGEIRKVSSVPIIFISSAADNMNIVMAVNMGADDFIAKPFDANVLIAKIQAMLRRTYDFAKSAPILEHRGAILSTGDNTLTYNSQKIELTKNEYRILLTLMQQKGKTVSRERLMERLWESDSFVDENTLTVNVNRLRKKLDAAGLDNFIKTKFGVGYIVQ